MWLGNMTNLDFKCNNQRRRSGCAWPGSRSPPHWKTGHRWRWWKELPFPSFSTGAVHIIIIISVDHNIKRNCCPVSQFYIMTRESICKSWDVSIWFDVFILESSFSRSILESCLFSSFFTPQYFDPFFILTKISELQQLILNNRRHL